jgi:hypothetical protein
LKTLPLSGSFVAIVDDEDFDRLNKWKWTLMKAQGGLYYAVRQETVDYLTVRMISLHREIMGNPKGYEVEHANNNGLDCRRSNLRLATRSQNMANRRKPKRNRQRKVPSSRYKGVTWDKRLKEWRAQIGFQKRVYHLGNFGDDELLASVVYDFAAIVFFGEFAKPNHPELAAKFKPEAIERARELSGFITAQQAALGSQPPRAR